MSHSGIQPPRPLLVSSTTMRCSPAVYNPRPFPPVSFRRRNRLAWTHRRRGLASDSVRYAGARSSVGRRFRSATKLRFEWYGGDFLLLQQRSKHPREIVITPKASTSDFNSTPPLRYQVRPDRPHQGQRGAALHPTDARHHGSDRRRAVNK